jgi:hypothetical protein
LVKIEGQFTHEFVYKTQDSICISILYRLTVKFEAPTITGQVPWPELHVDKILFLDDFSSMVGSGLKVLM